MSCQDTGHRCLQLSGTNRISAQKQDAKLALGTLSAPALLLGRVPVLGNIPGRETRAQDNVAPARCWASRYDEIRDMGR
jgi:hypothetical protein